MPLPDWKTVRVALDRALVTALPLLAEESGRGPIAALGIHVDAYYGSAGLYLLPESALTELSEAARDSLGDWPNSTDWSRDAASARAFASHWGVWDSWFSRHLGDLSEAEATEKFETLLRVACEAAEKLEREDAFIALPKARSFKILVVEHDEPDQLSLTRYEHFLRTREVLVDQ
jgi:hypothetical protein